MRHALQGVIAALRSRLLSFVAGFLFLYYFSPGFGTPLYYLMTDHLHFSQAFIGILSSVSAAGWIVGALLHRWVFRHLSIRALLNVSVAFGTVTTLAFLGMIRPISAVVVSLFAGAAAMIANIATWLWPPSTVRRGREDPPSPR